MKSRFILLSVFISQCLIGQENEINEWLIERAIDRPLIMHKGQLQINTGYELAIGNKRYDSSSEALKLFNDGAGIVKHLFDFEVKYGILEFIELSTSINYSRMRERSGQVWSYHGDESVYSFELNEYKGISDLNLGLNLQIPFQIDKFDWIVLSGIRFPIANYTPDKPSHSLTYLDPLYKAREINYTYNNKVGTGTYIMLIGTCAKFRTEKIAVTGFFNFSNGLNVVDSYYWQFRLYDNEFEYRKLSYKFKLGQTIDYSLLFDYQVTNSFNLFASVFGNNYSGGWNQITGRKIADYKKNLLSVGIGYELQLTPHIRLIQVVKLPITGKNELAPAIFYIGMNFNFITSQ